MMTGVRITVFIPVYNMADTIERAILSVLGQDYENKELIVLDGGSTDGTVEVVKKYLDRIAYFRSGPDGGSSKAIATNLHRATGEIVCMIGADDWYSPGALTAAAKTYEETRADVVYGDCMRINPAGHKKRISYARVNLDKMYLDCAIATTASFVKKNLLAEHYAHYFKEHEGVLKMATDYYLWLRLYHAGRRFCYISSELPITNFSMTGISSRYVYLGLIETEIVMKMVIGPKNSENEAYYQALERRFAAYSVPLYQKIIGNDRLIEIIRDITDGGMDYILFGAGDIGERFCILLQGCGYRVRYIADNSPENTGGFCAGVPVYAPERLLTERNAVLLISTVNYDEEVFQQVKAMKLDPSISVMTQGDFSLRIYQILGREILDSAWKKGIIQ